MAASFVTLRRYPYEEPDLLHVEFLASNGAFSGATDFYIDPDGIREMGQGLQRFPSRAPDQLVYEYGSDDPADRLHHHFLLRAYTTDAAGHCALQFAMSRNSSEPYHGVCRFSITTDAAALNRLGDLLIRFAELRHLELRWGPALDRAALFEDYQR